ncbi:MAG: GumC family protein [Devosia sp.]
MLDRNNASGQQVPAFRGQGGAIAGYDPAYDRRGYGELPVEPDEGFNPLKLLLYVVKYRWLIVIALAIALVVGGVVTLMQTPKYRATARVEIMVPSARVLEDMDVVAQSSDMRTFETAREKLKSRDLARRVVSQMGLATDAGFLFPAPDFSVGNIFARVFGSAPRASVDDFGAEQREAIAVSNLLADLDVGIVRGTSLLAVSFASTDREKAAAIANQVVRSYMDQQVDRTVETSVLARQFIEEQVRDLKERLETSEAELVAYARSVGISSTGTDGSLVSANIREINAGLSEAIRDRLTNERILAQAESGGAGALPQVAESETIQSLQTRRAGLQAEYQQNLTIYKPDFPQMRTMSAQIAEIDRQIQVAIAAIVAGIRLNYEGSVQAEADLRAKLAELEQAQADFQDKNIQYTILQREVESNRTQYQALIGKLNELTVVSELRRANIEVVDFAVTPGSPYAPSMARNLLMFLGVGAALAAALIYLLELLNNKFNVPDQIEADLQLPVLGIIPLMQGDISSVLHDTRSPISEAYRSLRTSLQFAGTDGAPKTLLVTSAEPGESKSTSAVKLAEEFAAIGVRVLIIDADLRRPTLHRQFKINNTSGLTNLLTNTVAQEDANAIFRPTAVENVTLLPSGPMVPNPADLLSSHGLGAIIDACAKAYDMVNIDGPPVLGLSDALILSRLSEATLLVVSAHQVPRKAAQSALKRLRSAGGHIIGATLNKLDVKRVEYSYAYRNMYSSYYGYGGEQPKLENKESQEDNAFAARITRQAERVLGRLRTYRPKWR